MRGQRLSPARVAGVAMLFAVGAVCGYLAAVVGHLILWPPDCTVSSCTGLDEVAWPIGLAGSLIGGAVYAVLGLAAGLPGRRPAPAAIPGVPAGAERATAALAQLTLFAGVPIIGPGAVALIAWRVAPFLRRHAVAAIRLQLWQLLLLAPTPVLFWPTIGLYTIVTLTAILGGLVYAVIGAVRAANGKLPAYPGNWPPSPGPPSITQPESIPPRRREHRARIALIALVVGIAANLLRLALIDT